VAGESLFSAWMVLGLALRRTYDHLGMVVFTSIIWFVFSFGPAVYGFIAVWNAPVLPIIILACLIIIFISGPVLAGIYAGNLKLIKTGEATIRDYWRGFRDNYKLTAATGAAMLFILLVLAVDMAWFIRHPGPFFRILSIPWGYLIGFWFLVAMYVFPFAIYKPAKWYKVLQRAVLLVLDNLVVTFIVAVAGGLAIYLSLLTRAPLVFFLAGFMTILHNTTFCQLMYKYEDDGGHSLDGEEKEAGGTAGAADSIDRKTT